MIEEEIQTALKELFFISETDAPMTLVTDPNAQLEVRDFNEFFERLTKIKQWFGEKEVKQAQGFARLKALLVAHLTDLHIVRIGRIEVQIYIVGKDTAGNPITIKTRAVET